MAEITRRQFIERAGMTTAAAGFVAAGVNLRADPLGLPIGSQTYPERQQIADGKFVDLLKNMYAAGIRQIELCSPGYAQFKAFPTASRRGRSSTTAESRVLARTSVVSGPTSPRSSNGRMTSA
jgi:hypothetical protein